MNFFYVQPTKSRLKRYWSNIVAPVQDQGRKKVKCAWIDANGDQPATGIQIHWTEFNKRDSTERNTGYYCSNREAMNWRTEQDPNTVIYYRRKRDLSASEQVSHTEPVESPAQRRRDSLPTGSLTLGERFANTLVKSLSPDHQASELCAAKGSAGPSAVSYDERRFCFMPTKSLYPFCEDVDAGLCWSDELEIVVAKGVTGFAVPPAMNFSSTLLWGED